MEGKSTLKGYKYKLLPGRKLIFDGSLTSWGVVLFFKARMDSLEINGHIYHWSRGMRSTGIVSGGVREY